MRFANWQLFLRWPLFAALACCALLAPSLALAQQATPASPAAPATLPAGRAAKNIAIITLRGEIDVKGVMLMSLNRRMDAAVRDGADAVVIEIDSPGGAMNTTLRICEAIKASPIQNTVAWVNPQAISGGALIALACREMVVNDPASLGDAMPVLVSGSSWLRGATAPTNAELLKKVLPPLLAEVTDSARRYNARAGGYYRDEYLSQAIVANDVALWLVQHKRTGVRVCIDSAELALLFPGASTTGPTRLASSPGSAKLQLPASQNPTVPVPAGSQKIALAASAMSVTSTSMRPVFSAADAGDWDLIDKVKDDTLPAILTATDLLHYGFADNPTTSVNGQPVLVAVKTDADIKAFFGATNLQRYDASWAEFFVDIFTQKLVQAILVIIFLVAAFIELTHPGAILPAIVSILALCLLVAPGLLIGMAAWWEVLAIVVGVGLIGLEILVIPGFGIPGVIGLILLFAGLIGLFVPSNTGPFPDSLQARDDWLWAAVTLMLSVGTAGVGMYLIAKHFGSLPLLGKLVLPTPLADEDAQGLLSAMEEPAILATPGERGVALTPLRPAGRVQLGDRVIDAVADIGFIDIGTPVRVTQVSPMRIAVERAT